MQKPLSLFLCLMLCFTSLFSCAKRQEDKEPSPQSKSYYEFFDTSSVIFSYCEDTAAEFEKNCKATADLLGEYHQLFDIYYEYAGVNNIKTINENAGKSPVSVDKRLIDFLLYTKEIYTLTGGKVNVAMGSVIKLWHDARENAIDFPDDAAVPEEAALIEAAKHTDINSIIINEAEGTVFITDPATSIDVGAIGKGYATEKAAELLISRGVTSYVLNIGGNIRAIGEKPSGKGWVTGITNPDKSSEESFVCKVDIKNTSLVTSGNYERYYVVDGVSYHHIIDPNTNMPARYFSSVSIFTENSGLADALSTALFCMSYEEGLALINTVGNTDAIWVSLDGEVKKTDGIKFYTE